MGRWIDALKKHENTPVGHPQNPQKSLGPTVSQDLHHSPRPMALAAALPDYPTLKSTSTVRISSDVRPQRLPRHPNPVHSIMERLEGDMDLYAEALCTYGPMSYGQAMHVLGWGGTRAGQAQSDLRADGRIAFNHLGRAYLIDEKDSNHVD